MVEQLNLQKTKSSFLLLEALASMMIIAIIIVVFINTNQQKHIIPSYASNILFKEILKSSCEAKTSSKILLGLKIHQEYKLEYDININQNIVVQYWTISSNKNKLLLKRRCYI